MGTKGLDLSYVGAGDGGRPSSESGTLGGGKGALSSGSGGGRGIITTGAGSGIGELDSGASNPFTSFVAYFSPEEKKTSNSKAIHKDWIAKKDIDAIRSRSSRKLERMNEARLRDME